MRLGGDFVRMAAHPDAWFDLAYELAGSDLTEAELAELVPGGSAFRNGRRDSSR